MITIEHIDISCSIVFSQLGRTEINEKLDILITQGESTMALLDKLTADVAAIGTVTGSAIILLNGLKAKLDACGTDPVKLAELSASLTSQKDALSAAITANTPADPVPGPTKTDINGNIIDIATGNMVNSDGTVRYAAGTFTAEPDGSHKDMAGNTILTSSIP